MRVTWRSLTAIAGRVVEDGKARADPLEGLRRVGIDEISYKKGHRYLTVVTDHGTGRTTSAAKGRDRATLGRFFDELGRSASAKLTEVSADGAEPIADVVHSRCLNARLTMDGFHVVGWATDATDEVRRELWNAARRQDKALATRLKGCRYVLSEEPRGPHRRAAGQARLGGTDQLAAAPGVPAQRRAPLGQAIPTGSILQELPWTRSLSTDETLAS